MERFLDERDAQRPSRTILDVVVQRRRPAQREMRRHGAHNRNDARMRQTNRINDRCEHKRNEQCNGERRENRDARGNREEKGDCRKPPSDARRGPER
jgi:hypothetical protein